MASGRSRALRKQLSTEDQALNMIAKEAEARLAAKRAARAEARSIRMKEIERKQREIDEIECEDSDKRSSSRMSSPLSASSSHGSEQNLSAVSTDNIKALLKESEDKYKKAMVNNAQLDNERQALLYQVEILKDTIEGLEESYYNTKDELQDKNRDYTKLSREHEKVTESLKKSTILLQDRERILDEHGINLDGTLKENDEADGETIEENHIESNHIGYRDSEERESFLSQIEALKNEVLELKSQNESIGSRKSVEYARLVEGADLERSFVDVSTEAAAIREEATHAGVYVNNNEKCDDFEVIDDGSQQGGIRNFEDKSFEKSGRSSLLSSVATNAVTESMESDVPLEISIDKSTTGPSGSASNRDDYDIVQLEDPPSKRATGLDIEALTARNERTPSPIVTSNINVNKYLFSDSDDEKNDSPVSSGTFNVDRYYCSQETTSNEKEPTESHEQKENVESTKEETLPEKTESQEVQRDSPFLEVESHVSDDEPITPTPYDSKENGKNYFEDDETLNINIAEEIENVTDRVTSPIEVSTETIKEESSSVVLGNQSSIETNIESGSNPQKEIEPLQISTEITNGNRQKDIDELNEESTIKIMETTSNNLSNTEQKQEEGLEPSTLVQEEDPPDRPNILNSVTFSDQSSIENVDEEPELNKSDLSVVDSDIRKSVQDLYEKIIGEAETNPTQNPNNDLPGDATFGVFSITGNASKSEDDLSQSDSNSNTSRENTNKDGKWLVRVESFSTAPKKTPEIKLIPNENSMESIDDVASASSPVDETQEQVPVPKERKKKKKKKGKNKQESTTPNSRSQESSEANTPIVSPSKRIEHKDIPQQFLDAHNHLAGESYSDVSDTETELAEDGTPINKKRVGSKKGDLQKQVQELKSQVARLEQDNQRQEGQVIRLESQVKRYRSQAESAEATEDNLLADKRKIARELRQCQDQINDLESENEQLQKRLDKLKRHRPK